MQLFDLKALMEQADCLPWNSWLPLLRVVSDLLIALCFYIIPVILVYVINKRKDIPYSRFVMLSGLFIIVCGTTHLMSAITVWFPLYRLDVYLKLVAAGLSLAMVFAMLRGIPRALTFAGPAQFQMETERCERIDKERLETVNRLQKMASCIPGMIFQCRVFTDGSFNFPYCSEGVEDIFGIDFDQIDKDGRELISRIHPDDYDGLINLIRRSAKHLTVVDHEFRIRLEDGVERWVMIHAKPEREEQSATLWHGFVYDITDKKQAENDIIELRRINNNLEHLVEERTTKLQVMNDEFRSLNETLSETIERELKGSRQKDSMLIQQSRLAAMGEMIGNIAHQWRQPINALSLVLANIEDLYQYGELNEEQLRKQVEKGERLVQTMSNTIDDFRNFFKSESSLEVFDVELAIKDTLSIVEASFKNNNIKVELIIPQPVNTRGFASQYRQVLLNILSNAKDALLERGIQDAKITITLHRENGDAVVCIRDNAGGIKTDVIDKVFDPYFTTRPQGNGIGLYMSKMIIESNMHGKLTVSNTEDGAEFCIWTDFGHDLLPHQTQRGREI